MGNTFFSSFKFSSKRGICVCVYVCVYVCVCVFLCVVVVVVVGVVCVRVCVFVRDFFFTLEIASSNA